VPAHVGYYLRKCPAPAGQQAKDVCGKSIATAPKEGP
jgi:hypothetical protein